MTGQGDRDTIERAVEAYLPDLLQRPENDLLQMASGPLLWAGSDMAGAAGIDPAKMPPEHIRMMLDTSRLREVICSPDNKSLITGTIDVANVTTLVGLVLPMMGWSPAAVPAGVVAVAVLVLKIGINQYCRGYQPPPPQKTGPERAATVSQVESLTDQEAPMLEVARSLAPRFRSALISVASIPFIVNTGRMPFLPSVEVPVSEWSEGMYTLTSEDLGRIEALQRVGILKQGPAPPFVVVTPQGLAALRAAARSPKG